MNARLDPATLELVVKVRESLKVLHGQMREVERALAALPQDQAVSIYVCPRCGLDRKSQERLEEHLAHVHAAGLDEAVPRPAEDQAEHQAVRRLDAILPAPPDAGAQVQPSKPGGGGAA